MTLWLSVALSRGSHVRQQLTSHFQLQVPSSFLVVAFIILACCCLGSKPRCAMLQWDHHKLIIHDGLHLLQELLPQRMLTAPFVTCRPHKEQHAVWQPAVCRTEEYAALQRHFQAFITAHASDDAQEPSDAAVAGAQQWLSIVEEAATSADVCGKRLLKSSLILMAYYHLFDTHRYSAALAETCPR